MGTPLKISAADLGTNTLKVTHATRHGDGELLDMEHASDTVRLGFNLGRTRRIEEQRIEACLRFLEEQETIGRAYGSTDFIGVATEALRVAENGSILIDRIHHETGWKIEIITGEREAELTYLGLADQVPEGVDCSIVDIGGGSTEIVSVHDGEVELIQSLAVGSGRLADRYFESDPPGESALEIAITSAADSISEQLNQDVQCGFVMLAGGSGLFMNMLIEQLWSSPPFDRVTLEKLANHLARVQAEDTVSRIDIPHARALVLPASVAVGIAIMDRFGADKAIGVPSGIRMGLIREYGH